MKALVIFDSVFGNTEKIARAIGSALDSEEDVAILRVSEVRPEQLAATGLLVVGSPTRAFQPTPATKKLLGSIPGKSLKGVRVAAFDTRVEIETVHSPVLTFFVKIFGYAAGPIAKRLQHKGGNLTAPPQGFYVKDSEGPLKEGELERAADWAKSILYA